jgi:hypothetical protein
MATNGVSPLMLLSWPPHRGAPATSGQRHRVRGRVRYRAAELPSATALLLSRSSIHTPLDRTITAARHASPCRCRFHHRRSQRYSQMPITPNATCCHRVGDLEHGAPVRRKRRPNSAHAIPVKIAPGSLQMAAGEFSADRDTKATPYGLGGPRSTRLAPISGKLPLSPTSCDRAHGSTRSRPSWRTAPRRDARASPVRRRHS